MTKAIANSNAQAATQLDALLNDRFHGAANIRGIRYQILYTVLTAIKLYREDSSAWSLDLEGIEDVDLKGVQAGPCYIQVKSAQHSWNWARLKDPISSFIGALRASPDSKFVLAVDFEPRGDLEKLSRIGTITGRESKRLKAKFRNLCTDVGATASEADHLLSHLQVTSKPESEVWHSVRRHMAEGFELASEATDVYIHVLVSRFLDWARERKTVVRSDIDRVRAEVGEALSRESSFQAYGLGLVGRLAWGEAGFDLGFFEGKGARPEHIAAGLDVARPAWSERIGESLSRFRTCVIRASSGQGKSTLMYRYAHDHWPDENTFVLRTAQTPHDVQLIVDYLRFRASLFPPLRLLIDNAGWQTPLWTEVAQEVASLGGQVLVSIRREDWHRFARESSLSYGLLDPYLDLSEARMIFQAFRQRDRIHKEVSSAEWAYERVGGPHLLIEYVYLITQGRMLEERLRDQIQDFSALGEDPAKLEILRRVSVASTFGAPLVTERLVHDLRPMADAQQTLQSLVGEYVESEGGLLRGLHWVRSNHLVSILHEYYPSITTTAINALPAVPHESLAAFIAGAVSCANVDSDELLSALVENLRGAGIEQILACLEGVYEGGERLLFAKNRELFEEAYRRLGSAGSFLLSTHFMLFHRTNMIDEMVSIFSSEKTGFNVLQEIAAKAQLSGRGLDLCKRFLSLATPHIKPDALQDSLPATGRILDWCALAGISLPAWEDAEHQLSDPCSAMPVEDLCTFAQGLYRYDQPAYKRWFRRRREDIIGTLKLELDCISLQVERDVSISFLLDPEGSNEPGEQALSRLDLLRQALPFCQHYRSEGVWPLPFGLQPSVDETVKDIPQESLPFRSDIDKNVVWRTIVETEFAADTYYRYQEHWYQLRLHALALVSEFTKWLKRRFSAKSVSDSPTVGEANEVNRLVAQLPDPPAQMPAQLAQPMKTNAGGWASHLQNFAVQICGEPETARLAVFNFREASRLLPQMHDAMADMLVISPDHFGMAGLVELETTAFLHLEEVVEVVVNQPVEPQTNVVAYVRALRDRNTRELVSGIRRALEVLVDLGLRVSVAERLYVEHPLRYLPLIFSVIDPSYPELTLAPVCAALASATKHAEDRVDFLYLVPVHCEARILDGGYRLSMDKIRMISEGEAPNWESFVPIEAPRNVLTFLQGIPVRPPVVFQLRLNLQGLYTHLDLLREIEKWINPLGNSPSRYDHELYTRWRGKLDRLRDEALHAAENLDQFLQTHFEDGATGSISRDLRQSIIGIRIGLASGSDGGTVMSASGLTLDRIADVVHGLSLGSPEPSD